MKWELIEKELEDDLKKSNLELSNRIVSNKKIKVFQIPRQIMVSTFLYKIENYLQRQG